MAHLEIGTFGESQGYLGFRPNYLEDGAKGVTTAGVTRLGWVKRLDLDLFWVDLDLLDLFWVDLDLFWVELNPLILTCISEF